MATIMYLLNLSQKQLDCIEHDFASIPAHNRADKLFSVFNECDEKELICMKYLYAYMPVSDLANYTGGFLLKTVRDTLKAVSMVPWGEKIQGELFLNYVLPLRLNNEDLVDHRESFFRDIFPRVKNLSMEQAVIEINYWCYEHATYQSTDIRTSSPLNVIRNAFGRCGEESVLCTAALRSVGIPARQCYTPWWAHCDDNHAWVEVWVDGKWHFIGACEPEAALDKGWYVETSKRGMLVHARVFSRMVTEPEITNQTAVMTQVNVLNHYAKTKTITVTVTDERYKPVEGAEVRFELVNSARFCPIAVIDTNKEGQAHILTGLGDLYIHVSYNSDSKVRFLHKKADQGCTELKFCLADARLCDEGEFELDLIPPAKEAVFDEVMSEEVAKCHAERMRNADILRHAFEDTFISGDKAKSFALNFNEQQEEIAQLIALSNGNHQEIKKFLETQSNIPLSYRVALLKSLRKKDLSDSTAEMLESHLKAAYPYCNDFSEEIFNKYVLCPRVYFEMLSSYREFIKSYFSEKEKSLFISDPKAVNTYINSIVADCKDRDYATIFATPQGLLELKCGSEMSKRILFVAICRTLGVPARMSEIDLNVEYFQGSCWHTIAQADQKAVERKSKLILINEAVDIEFAYQKNFTIARLENGVYNTLGLSDNSLVDNRVEYTLLDGHYRLTTANRLNDGSLLTHITYFVLTNGEEKQLSLILRQPEDSEKEKVLLPKIYLRTDDEETVEASRLLDSDENHAIAFIQEGNEPTEHLLNEILEQRHAFTKKRKSVLLIVKNEESLKNSLLQEAISQTGIKVAYRHEKDGFNDIIAALKSNNNKLPLVMGMKKNNYCVFHTSGYNVGTGDLLLRHLKS